MNREQIAQEMTFGDKIVQYWDKQPTTIDGVLGGYQDVHTSDIRTSHEMIRKTQDYISGYDQALDCGAGIGRITQFVLLKNFENSDLLEQSGVQINEARNRVP